MKKYFPILVSMVGIGSLMAQMPDEINNMFAEKPKGENQAGKKDCDKAAKDEQKAAEDNLDNPMAGIAATMKVMCSALEQIAWQPVDIAKLPPKSKGKNIPKDSAVKAMAESWWAGGQEGDYVKVLSAGITDSDWNRLEMSDTPGVASARVIGGYHTIKAKLADKKEACFFIPSSIKQENLNFPNGLVKPKWGASKFSGQTTGKGQRIPCKAAK